jgi:hypothetical protein
MADEREEEIEADRAEFAPIESKITGLRGLIVNALRGSAAVTAEASRLFTMARNRRSLWAEYARESNRGPPPTLPLKDPPF